MQALILAAGLGTRLRPLTNERPKALVEINGHTLLEINIRRIIKAGASQCVVNVHHFGDMVIQAVGSISKSYPSVPLRISDERDLLLDTGGAIKHAAPLFSDHEPILVHNVDVISDLDLQALEQYHRESGNLVSLCVSDRDSRRKLLFDDTLHSRDTGAELPNTLLRSYAFSGIAMISPELPSLLPPDDHPYPIIDEYLRLANQYRIGYYLHDANRWMDVGSIDKLRVAEQAEWVRENIE